MGQLILVWTPGKASPIHDHADAHCVMKVGPIELFLRMPRIGAKGSYQVLKGCLQETLYTWPDRNLVNDGKPSPLKIKKETIYGENQVTYMSDNVSPKQRSSLLYT